MKFKTATTKGIKADIAKHEITITFVVSLNTENMNIAEELAPYTDEDAGDVELNILPYQRSFINQ